MTIPDEDQDLFAEAMRKVSRISPPEKVRARPSAPGQLKRIIKNAAVNTAVDIPSVGTPSQNAVRMLSQDEPWSLVADGVSRERLKRLAGGQPAVDLEFDLHGMRQEEALNLLAAGFQKATAGQMRVLCIIHGRGLHSEGKKPILKQATYHWLQEGPFSSHVLAAIPQPGSGGGACLVLLRKG